MNKAIIFKIFETVEGTDGTINAQGVEILLEQEDGGGWQMVQEWIFPDDEMAPERLLPQNMQQ